MFTRPAQDETDLKAVNEELKKSLERCRELLADCRSQLAANTNDQEPSALSRRNG